MRTPLGKKFKEKLDQLSDAQLAVIWQQVEDECPDNSDADIDAEEFVNLLSSVNREAVSLNNGFDEFYSLQDPQHFNLAS